MATNTQIKDFLEGLEYRAIRKEKMYDGSGRDFDIDTALRFATEELGEIASAITRHRFLLAQDECIDLAHSAMLLWVSLEEKNANI